METYGEYTPFAGNSLRRSRTFSVKNELFALMGDNGDYVPFDESALSKHILLLGGVGSGKSNVFYHLVRNISFRMSEKDVMIIFDSKGDYYDKFYKEGDIVISNDDRATDFWNIFNEVTIDSRVDENITEVANYLFKDKIKRSSNPFFPSAAKDVFASLMTYMMRVGKKDLLNNAYLRDVVDSRTDKDYRRYFSHYSDLRGVSSYIGEDAMGQTQGVISEYQQTLREVFVGNFRKNGDFSIRQAVKNKGKKVIFIEYDLGLGRTLAPIYGLLIDLAIKEALCRKSDEGNVYFIMDEFRLMTSLEHMDNGINFGRSLGAKFILGLQNVEQMYDVYGEHAGKSILSGCSTLLSFFVLDRASREYIKERAGNNLKKIQYMSTVSSHGIVENVVNGNTIEDWDISNLEVGQGIVQCLNHEPFIFKYRLFK